MEMSSPHEVPCKNWVMELGDGNGVGVCGPCGRNFINARHFQSVPRETTQGGPKEKDAPSRC